MCGAGNDCQHPVDAAYLSSWIAGFDALLTNVTSTFTNVYVNLVSTLDLSNVARIQRSTVFCAIEHKYLLKECGCIDRGNATELVQLDENVHTFDAALKQLAGKWQAQLKAQGREDIAIVYQDFMEGVGASLDMSFLNSLDCFHPSTRGHEMLAVSV